MKEKHFLLNFFKLFNKFEFSYVKISHKFEIQVNFKHKAI
jgi:hypothetical protein